MGSAWSVAEGARPAPVPVANIPGTPGKQVEDVTGS